MCIEVEIHIHIQKIQKYEKHKKSSVLTVDSCRFRDVAYLHANINLVGSV
jgi:hypothetical protein